jgi:hypothetical protein
VAINAEKGFAGGGRSQQAAQEVWPQIDGNAYWRPHRKRRPSCHRRGPAPSRSGSARADTAAPQ